MGRLTYVQLIWISQAADPDAYSIKISLAYVNQGRSEGFGARAGT